jgi:uncharacterized MAPEG superfamily protein
MTETAVELKLLGAAVVVGLVQLAWAAGAARRQQGLAWAAGPRDEPIPVSGVAARLDRAFWNFLETFPFFAAAILAVVLAGKTGPLSLWGGAAYVIARAIYVPLYASGIPRIRSLVWFVGFAGVIAVIVALFQ